MAKVGQLLGVTWDTCLRGEEPLGLRAGRPRGLAIHPHLCGARLWGGQPGGSATASLSSPPTASGQAVPLLPQSTAHLGYYSGLLFLSKGLP